MPNQEATFYGYDDNAEKVETQSTFFLIEKIKAIKYSSYYLRLFYL